VPIRYSLLTIAAQRLSRGALARYAGVMTVVASINPQIVEALYVEALVLSDAARSGFDALRQQGSGSGHTLHAVAGDALPGRATGAAPGGANDVEVTCEALRTTTRVMHCLAWVLNQRAWLAGQITATQLRSHGRLVSHFPASDPAVVARLPADLAALVDQSECLYHRIDRLDTAWRGDRAVAGGAIDRLRHRLEHTRHSA
jgi:regulator of CtrA degradation